MWRYKQTFKYMVFVAMCINGRTGVFALYDVAMRRFNGAVIGIV